MNIKVVNEGEKTTVCLSGNVDTLAAEKFGQTLDQIAANNRKEVIIDFEGVNFIGSSGIGKLLFFNQVTTSRGGRVQIVNLNKEIEALFTSAKLDKLFNI